MTYTKFAFLVYLLATEIRYSTQSCNTEVLEYTRSHCYYTRSRLGCQEVPDTFSVTCTGEAIDSVATPEASSKVKRITISETTSPTIASSAFNIYTNLVNLTIYYGSIENIHPGAFNGLTNLQQLEITNQNVTILPKGVLNSLTTMEKLDFSDNYIHTIEKYALLGTVSLKMLSLRKNSINDITELENLCSSIEVLDLSHNEISNLISFENFTKLTNITLNSNKIVYLSDDTFAHTPIKRLILSENFIDSFDSNAFIGMALLKELNLASNYLWKVQNGTLPLGIFRDNKLLQYLNISRTGLTTLRVGMFTGLKNILTLDLSFNKLTYLPKGIFHDLQIIRNLYLDHNKLTHFEYDGFGQLNTINLNNNLWNCDTLSNITRNLQSAQIIRGTVYNTTNIYGISCFEEVQHQNYNPENNTSSLQPMMDVEIYERLSKSIIDSYRSFFGDVRKDLKTLYEEFSTSFLITFKEICFTSPDVIKPAKNENDYEVETKLSRSTDDKPNAINDEDRTNTDEAVNEAAKFKSGSSFQTYDTSSNATAILVCILIVLILILFVLIFMVHLVIKVKSENEFRNTQVSLLDNVRL